MPPRPEGTDGSDHAYRMVIAERYQRMADYKHSITRLMATHVVLSLGKCAWTALGFMEGHPIPVYMLGMLAGEAAVIGVFAAAKMGTLKESLTALKVYNMLQALVAATHILTAWRYHNGLNLEQHQYSKIAQRYILDRTSAYSPDTVQQVTLGFEMFLDCTLGAFLLFAVLVSHRMIKEKMELKKEAAAKGARRGGLDKKGEKDSDDDDVPQAVPLEGDAGSPERRVAAKASMRARRRMA